MLRKNNTYKYKILEMILRGEETLALSKEERGLFKSREALQKQALFCGVGKAPYVEDPTDVPTSRYIEMQSGLMQKQSEDLFYILGRKAAERDPVHTVGKAPRSYARAAFTAYISAQKTRTEGIEREVRFLDYEEGVDYGLAPTPAVYDAAAQKVDARIQALKTAFHTALEASRILSAHLINLPKQQEGIAVQFRGEKRRVTYSLAAPNTRSNSYK